MTHDLPNLCGSRGFAGPSGCVLLEGHDGPHSYGDFDSALKEHKDKYWRLRAERAEAENAKLRELLADLRPMVYAECGPYGTLLPRIDAALGKKKDG